MLLKIIFNNFSKNRKGKNQFLAAIDGKLY